MCSWIGVSLPTIRVVGGSPTEPGWYDDPAGEKLYQAYWDGDQWTGETRWLPEPTKEPTPRSTKWAFRSFGLIGAGIAVLLFVVMTMDWNEFGLYGAVGALLFLGLVGAGVIGLIAALTRGTLDARQSQSRDSD